MNEEFHAKAQRRKGPGAETRSQGQRTKDLQSHGTAALAPRRLAHLNNAQICIERTGRNDDQGRRAGAGARLDETVQAFGETSRACS